MTVGAFTEPIVVLSLLIGGTVINRTKRNRREAITGWQEQRLSTRSRNNSLDDLEVAAHSDKLLSAPNSSSRAPSPSDNSWHEREVHFFGWHTTLLSPNTRAFRTRGLSRLLQRFPFVVEVYQLGRAFTAVTLVDGTVNVARRHALQLIHLEQRLSIFWEPKIQGAFVAHPALMHWINRTYSYVHIPASIFFLIWLYYITTTRNRDDGDVPTGSPAGPKLFEARRRTMATCNLIAFIIFTVWPCMPPRLLSDKSVTGPVGKEARSFGFIDTVHGASGESSVWTQNRFCNQYAAMPSLHFGYALLIGLTVGTIPLPRNSRRRLSLPMPLGGRLRFPPLMRLLCALLGFSYTLVILVAIVSTANHFILDAVAGAAVCAVGWYVSGEAPQVPVASRKSGSSWDNFFALSAQADRNTGNIFEKRLIEAYIQENGRDPVTGEELSVEDLVDLKTSRAVKPRPPTLTSIPSLLSVFQNEWDALALESYTLKQSLSQLRQELSTALYNNDAAIRVIGRLTKERDEARDALSRLSIGEQRQKAANGNGDAMQYKANMIPRLSKTRRKRAVPKGWASADSISSFETPASTTAIVPAGSRCLALSVDRSIALVGGSDGQASLYSIEKQEITQKLNTSGGAIQDGALIDNDAVVLATSSGQVQVYKGAKKTHAFSSHAGATNGVTVHPTGELLASVGTDKSFVLYDLAGQTVLSQVYTNADGQIKVFETNTGANAANFETGGPVQSLSFSENGTWLASVSTGSSSVSVWDLRKANEIKIIDLGSSVESVQWDYTGQFLAAAGSGSVAVQHYDKSSKSWSEPLRKAASGMAVQWGANANSLILLTQDGAVSVLQSYDPPLPAVAGWTPLSSSLAYAEESCIAKTGRPEASRQGTSADCLRSALHARAPRLSATAGLRRLSPRLWKDLAPARYRPPRERFEHAGCIDFIHGYANHTQETPQSAPAGPSIGFHTPTLRTYQDAFDDTAGDRFVWPRRQYLATPPPPIPLPPTALDSALSSAPNNTLHNLFPTNLARHPRPPFTAVPAEVSGAPLWYSDDNYEELGGYYQVDEDEIGNEMPHGRRPAAPARQAPQPFVIDLTEDDGLEQAPTRQQDPQAGLHTSQPRRRSVERRDPQPEVIDLDNLGTDWADPPPPFLQPDPNHNQHHQPWRRGRWDREPDLEITGVTFRHFHPSSNRHRSGNSSRSGSQHAARPNIEPPRTAPGAGPLRSIFHTHTPQNLASTYHARVMRHLGGVANHISAMARMPDMLDYNRPAFDLGYGDFQEMEPHGRPAVRINPPPAAKVGFTRAPVEDENAVPVCPSCEMELCTGESEVKKQVFAVKGCGHVYCGDCALNRHKTSAKSKGKEPAGLRQQLPRNTFSQCVVDGCTQNTKTKASMVQIFL
ncbi:hypothetical protein FH972_024544 [Carpinus fangiana]|uniref:Pre-mRNA-processing factor 19 n=1 Tax=Carpinus fangiana TaxID=176857 RepID=A0A5N6KYQ1_9ROSI|nr:hypothetical protein FH972_024544 [Carpinus fangiana]